MVLKEHRYCTHDKHFFSDDNLPNDRAGAIMGLILSTGNLLRVLFRRLYLIPS
jgi:hypothetical protein